MYIHYKCIRTIPAPHIGSLLTLRYTYFTEMQMVDYNNVRRNVHVPYAKRSDGVVTL